MGESDVTDETAVIDQPEAEPLPALPSDFVQPVDPVKHFLPVPWDQIREAAAMISTAPGLAKEFDKPENCMFIAYQAARWGADPVAVATKTFFTPRKGGGMAVGYEAQLVHALVEADPDLKEPLDFEFAYAGDKPELVERYCRVIGHLRGVKKPRILVTPKWSQISPKNSPLWYSDPDQQLSYYGARAWARRHRPGRLLGVYSRDELDRGDVIEGTAREIFEEEAVPPISYDVAPGGRQQSNNGGGSNNGGDGRPEPPPEGEPAPRAQRRQEPAAAAQTKGPDDIEEIRAWALEEEKRLKKLPNADDMETELAAMVDDQRFGRLTAYDQAISTTIKSRVRGQINFLRAHPRP
jgi:hypothetical protein